MVSYRSAFFLIPRDLFEYQPQYLTVGSYRPGICVTNLILKDFFQVFQHEPRSHVKITVFKKTAVGSNGMQMRVEVQKVSIGLNRDTGAGYGIIISHS